MTPDQERRKPRISEVLAAFDKQTPVKASSRFATTSMARLRAEQSSREAAGALVTDLGLSKEQAARFEELRQAHFAEARVFRDRGAVLRREILAAALAGAEGAKLSAMSAEIGNCEAAVERMAVAYYQVLMGILTEEQKPRFREFVEAAHRAAGPRIFPPI